MGRNPLKQILASRSAVDHNEDSEVIADPVFLVVDKDGVEYRGTKVWVHGPSVINYDHNERRGRRVWIETLSGVTIDNGTDFTSIFLPLESPGEHREQAEVGPGHLPR